MIPRKKTASIWLAAAGTSSGASEIEPTSYGGGKIVDIAMSGQNNRLFLKDDYTIRLVGPNFPVSKTLQETKAITGVVAVASSNQFLAALDDRGKVHAWTWWTPDTDINDGPAYSVDTSMMPADIVGIASGSSELKTMTKAGLVESYDFKKDRKFAEKVNGSGRMPDDWQRITGYQPPLAILKKDGSWQLLGNTPADLAPVLPKDRRVLDIAPLIATDAKNNWHSACVLWIEPPDSAAPKAAP